jgi:hypothetical protein
MSDSLPLTAALAYLSPVRVQKHAGHVTGRLLDIFTCISLPTTWDHLREQDPLCPVLREPSCAPPKVCCSVNSPPLMASNSELAGYKELETDTVRAKLTEHTCQDLPQLLHPNEAFVFAVLDEEMNDNTHIKNGEDACQPLYENR